MREQYTRTQHFCFIPSKALLPKESATGIGRTEKDSTSRSPTRRQGHVRELIPSSFPSTQRKNAARAPQLTNPCSPKSPKKLTGRRSRPLPLEVVVEREVPLRRRVLDRLIVVGANLQRQRAPISWPFRLLRPDEGSRQAKSIERSHCIGVLI